MRKMLCVLCLLFAASPLALSQTSVTGAFFGTVVNGQTHASLVDAKVEITNTETNARYVRRTDASGNLYIGGLPPGNYRISISAEGFITKTIIQTLYALRPNELVPVPIELKPVGTTATTPATSPASPPATLPATPPATLTATTPATKQTVSASRRSRAGTSARARAKQWKHQRRARRVKH